MRAADLLGSVTGRVYDFAGGQPIPVTWSAVVQLFLMAVRAAESVMVPLQTAFLSLVSVPSLVEAVLVP
ncbi:hypothetical protein [Streptomyces canus]|uniref:hypothetical protein n=1 Tax=Streptomyces canus TaxID=58343 RepID=UPI002784C0FA|nr:hypothetical protein [Streptomyces canus]MDQ1073764.1 hypothetical protein [Streptomyces canus]